MCKRWARSRDVKDRLRRADRYHCCHPRGYYEGMRGNSNNLETEQACSLVQIIKANSYQDLDFKGRPSCFPLIILHPFIATLFMNTGTTFDDTKVKMIN